MIDSTRSGKQGRFAEFMQAMQSALEKVGKRFVVDISSRWGGDIVGESSFRNSSTCPFKRLSVCPSA